jgi:hypothetical protein
MPRLQELTIVAYTGARLLRLTLVDTSISSLQLTYIYRDWYKELDEALLASWVDDTVRLLRSAPRLERLSICAPVGIVAGLSEALANDPNLCMELDSLIIDKAPENELDANGEVAKNAEASFEQLRSNVAASIYQRRLRRLKN